MTQWKLPVPSSTGAVASLDGFELYRQETDHTCGPAAVRMVLRYMGHDIPERELAAGCLTHPFGTLHWTLAWGFSRFARRAGHRVVMSQNDPNIYEKIVRELKHGRPVLFMYAFMANRRTATRVTHYGVTVGIDEAAGTVRVAESYGSMDSMPLDEWWARFSLLPEYMPAAHVPLIHLGLLKPRTAFFLQPL